ncbi:hypothetical protein B0H19DRAFT_1182269 [Mycena capillaripes]|nr:hypothetical protein B0H19DRAFT_1182269 [Mycena capillaripes]
MDEFPIQFRTVLFRCPTPSSRLPPHPSDPPYSCGRPPLRYPSYHPPRSDTLLWA